MSLFTTIMYHRAEIFDLLVLLESVNDLCVIGQHLDGKGSTDSLTLGQLQLRLDSTVVHTVIDNWTKVGS